MIELHIEVFEIVKSSTEKEVLANKPERPLDLALGLCPVRLTSPRANPGHWMESADAAVPTLSLIHI